MIKELLEEIEIEVFDRIRNAQDSLQLNKAEALARFYSTVMMHSRLNGDFTETQ